MTRTAGWRVERDVGILVDDVLRWLNEESTQRENPFRTDRRQPWESMNGRSLAR